MLESSERLAVDNSVTVALVAGAGNLLPAVSLLSIALSHSISRSFCSLISLAFILHFPPLFIILDENV